MAKPWSTLRKKAKKQEETDHEDRGTTHEGPDGQCVSTGFDDGSDISHGWFLALVQIACCFEAEAVAYESVWRLGLSFQ